MSATPALTAPLQRQVGLLEEDLRVRAARPETDGAWRARHAEALAAGRTGLSYVEWRDDRVTQAAVAWVLVSVFVRFGEDNGLVRPVWIRGPGVRRQEALDAQAAYFRAHPDDTDREWLRQAIAYLADLPATAGLVDEHSALWLLEPGGDAVTALLGFWRETDEDGVPVWDLTDPRWDTRFLGDLYQDLSEAARSRYALLQTPVFVEEFILDRTLDPALAERPLDGFRLIDPTCGSGHFLLGAFERLLDRWHRLAPAMDRRERVQTALDAIHGVDLNPYAVAIARFRLTLAALRASGLTRLEDAPAFRYHLAVGDSLLHGSAQRALDLGMDLDTDVALSGFAYATEDLAALREILQPGRYDCVVGNPPYITVKDKALNAAYRERYATCHRQYALTVPFMERFFGLAKTGERAGWVGQITSNSFMKREFGAKLIEQFLARQDLRLVADTSGAYIPGHGTPTVIIVGRHHAPVGSAVRAILGIRGEPGRPDDAAKGLVWTSIVEHVDDPGWNDEWVTVTDLDRSLLATHPWSLSGGGAVELREIIERSCRRVVGGGSASIGYTGQTNADDVFLAPAPAFVTHGVESLAHRQLVVGEVIRDYVIGDSDHSVFLYDDHRLLPIGDWPGVYRWMWPCRSTTWARATFGKVTYRQEGRSWWEWHQVALDRLRTPLSIAFAFVATHNHFVLDRGGKVFKQSAPVIKLPEGAGEDEHLALLGVLNSSTACFWLKQNSHNKGVGGIGGGIGDEAWEPRYEFTGTTLQDYPLPAALPVSRGRLLDGLAQRLSASTPAALVALGTPSRGGLDAARTEHGGLRARMVAEQEELDWECYRLYGLVDDDLTDRGDDLPGLALGERAFEIVLARQVAAGSEQTAWFVRHGSTPITEVPAHWSAAYRSWWSGGSSSSSPTRTSACWSARSTSAAGQPSRGPSRRSGRFARGCWTGSSIGTSGSTGRAGRRHAASRSSPTTWPATPTWCRCWGCGRAAGTCR